MTRVRIALAAFFSAVFLCAVPADRSDILFPRDHGSHPDAALEWWYYTGHLRGSGGREYGFQLTFFRAGEMSFAHFAWSDVARGEFRYEEKAHLSMPGIASAAVGRLAVVNEDWSAEASGNLHRLHAAGRGWDLSLALSPAKPPVLNGERGISRKGPGENDYSRYVSIPRLSAAGRMRRGNGEEALSGTAWFDHEWGPGGLPTNAVGWDWFALQLDDGSELMLYRIRGRDGAATPFSSGTFVPASGEPRAISWKDVKLEETAVWKSPRSGARYPARWKLGVASLALDVAVTPLLPDQELVTGQSTGVTYWEGACRVEGTRGRRPLSGRAYAELTGYAGRDVPGSRSALPDAPPAGAVVTACRTSRPSPASPGSRETSSRSPGPGIRRESGS
jgi:predicted secreted hydrolase